MIAADGLDMDQHRADTHRPWYTTKTAVTCPAGTPADPPNIALTSSVVLAGHGLGIAVHGLIDHPGTTSS